MITAEEKFKHQKNGNVHRYVYYHCTKQRRNPRCTQDAIREELLVEQIERFLCRIEVSQDFSDWAIKSVDELVEADQSAETSHVASSSKRLNEIQSSLRELTRMRYRQQIPDDEFERERQILQVEESRINTDLKRGISDTIWRDGAKFIYDALAQISIRFKKADPETQRGLVSAVGSNLQLKDKKLIIEAMEPIGMIHKGYLDFLEALGPFEPPKNGSTATPSPYWHAALRLLCTLANDVRTYFAKHRDVPHQIV